MSDTTLGDLVNRWNNWAGNVIMRVPVRHDDLDMELFRCHDEVI